MRGVTGEARGLVRREESGSGWEGVSGGCVGINGACGLGVQST